MKIINSDYETVLNMNYVQMKLIPDVCTKEVKEIDEILSGVDEKMSEDNKTKRIISEEEIDEIRKKLYSICEIMDALNASGDAQFKALHGRLFRF